MNSIVQELSALGVEEVRLNEPLSRHTTWKVGGPADLFIYPHSKEECQHAFGVIQKHQLPWRVIGRGSNLLVKDHGIRGVVIKLGKGFDQFNREGTQVTVGGGYSTVLLAAVTAKQGLSGLEFAGGIPGNIGGAVYMNAGAHGSDVSEILVSAEVLLETGEYRTLSNKELKFRYRTTILQEELRGIVTEATFQLKEGDRKEITASLAKFKNYRRTTQPIDHPCAGSVFRNPPGGSAGQLIEKAGLKGFRIGGAEISQLHGNFIINCGGASAEDVLSLIAHARGVIKEKFDIELVPEVQVVDD